jgi:hypothetical protein
MGLISDKNVNIFDLAEIKRGDAISVRRAGETKFRNGLVTKTSESQLEILYSNIQNNSTSYLQISAVDVAVGVWEIYWTTDFKTINYQPGAGVGGD